MGDLNPDTLANLKVTELKAELKKRGLPIAGLKAVLVDRLRESLTATAEEEPVEEEEEEKEAEATDEPAAEEPVDATPEGPPEAVAEGTVVVAQEETAVAEEPGTTTAAEEPQGNTEELNDSTTEQPKDTATEEPKDTATEEPKEVTPEEPKEAISEEPRVDTAEKPKVDAAPEEDAPPPQEPEPIAEPAPMEVDEQSQVPEQSEPAHEAVAEAQPAEPLPETSSVAQPTADASPETKVVEADPSPETEMTDAAPAPTTSEPGPETTLTVGDARPTIPSPLPDDTPPIVLTTSEPMDTSDPDTLKRKRRSPSPPPPSIPDTTETQGTISPPTTKKAKTSASPSASPRRQPPPPRDARFTHLVDAPTYTSADSAADEPPITPSIHPATRALYIRDFVRPLNEAALRRHILTLATPADASPDAAVIESFFLDAIKSHCFIVFTNLAAASRVRRDIHGKVFPNERNRKPLWADFVPEEDVAKWVETEKVGSGGINKWEVVYDTQGEEVSVELVKNGQPAVRADRGKSVDISGAPSGPKGNVRQERAPKRVVMDLDQLFMSTRTKPKLYYLPVDREVARERLAKVNRDLKGRY